MKFPINLKLLRKRYGFSQERLAERLNRTNTTISNWEKGLNNPDFESLIILKNIFEIDIDSLLFKDIGNYSSNSEIKELLNEPETPYGNPNTEGVIEKMQRQILELEKRIERIEAKNIEK